MDMKLAKTIIRLRKQKRWSQQRLADEAEVSYATIFRAEAGALTRYDNIEKIMKALDVGMEELNGGQSPHAEILELYRQLSDKHKSLVLELARELNKK